MTSSRPLVIILPLGLGAAAIALAQVCLPGSPLLEHPSSFLWVSLAVLVALIPVRRLMGTPDINLSSLVIFTTLVLFGTGAAVITAWAVGLVSVASSRSGNNRADLQRAMLDSGRYAAGVVAAGLALWGLSTATGAADAGLDPSLVLRVFGAYALYLGVRGLIKSAVIGLRDGTGPWHVKTITSDFMPASVWIVPAAAYILALIFLNSGVLTVTMLASVLLVHGLTAAEEQGSRSSWIRLTDGLRQACDGHVANHRGESQRVLRIATGIGRRMKLPPWNLKLLGDAAALHNVGYIALDSAVALRPGRLSPEEIAAVKQHPECGRRILAEVPGMDGVAEIVRDHHESPDGRGYPRGLKGDAIPIEAAIIKVAEAFVAMTSPRVYRGRTLSADQATEEICKYAATSFDPIAAYFLVEMMGRADLASDIAGRFGLPDRAEIATRLSKCRRDKSPLGSPATISRRRLITGGALLATSVATILLFTATGSYGPGTSPPLWFTLDTPAALFFTAILGLALYKSVRLAWGAQVSWASGVVLAMVLAGGPIYIPISGMALVGWTLLFGSDRQDGVHPAGSLDAPVRGKPDGTSDADRRQDADDERVDIAPIRLHQRVLVRIDRSNRVWVRRPGIAYCMVLMLAGGSAWAACRVGQHLWGGTLAGLLLSPLLLGIVATGVFYLVETLLQAGLFSRPDLSLSRVWRRNYAGAFPEPLTYAMFGYGIYLVSGLLGMWTALLLFALPAIWRHKVLVSRSRTAKANWELVRSIAKAVDLRSGVADTHAAGVAATATAVARQMDQGEAFVEDLESAALLHDIGKASWSNRVLTQRVSRNPEEERYRYIHPDMSADIAIWAGYPRSVAEMIRSHHEHHDGSGYTRGLKGDEIPLGSRILCAADALACMIQPADARYARTLPEAVRELRFGAGKQFDPRVINAILQVLERAVFSRTVQPERAEHAEVGEDAGALA